MSGFFEILQGVQEWKWNKVIWPLTPKYDLDLEASHTEHCFCTSSQSGKHLCQVSSKSFKGFKSYRAEGKQSHMTFDPLTLKPAIRNIASARRLSLVNICVRFFEILQGVQELQSGREIVNGQTDGQTDGHRGDNIIRPFGHIKTYIFTWLGTLNKFCKCIALIAYKCKVWKW